MAELNGIPVDLEALQKLALINYGHFTSMRVEAGKVRGLSRHLDRLARDCRALFDADIDRDQVRKFVRQAVGANPAEAINLRVTVFDPGLEMGHPGSHATPQYLVTFRAAAPSEALPPLRLQSAPYSREMPLVKHIGLCGTIGLRRKAQLAGFDDVLFIRPDGRISEGATWNIGFFDGDRLVWPDADVLNGVTMQLIRTMRPESVVRSIDTAALATMQAAFATNVSIGVRAIKSVDGVTFDENHPAITTLRSEYLAIAADDI